MAFMSDPGLRVSADQLIALNDEIATLVRAGVPLELGLRQLSGNVSHSLGRISDQIANKLDQGQPLSKSITETLPGLPPVYAAVVDAGLQSGNLPRALESMSRFAQQGIELRQRIEFAFMYPLAVLLLAYALFMTFVVSAVPRWQEIWSDPGHGSDNYFHLLRTISDNSHYWGWILPACVAFFVFYWFAFARNSFLPDRRPSAMLSLIPGLWNVVAFWHWSNFCELLSTLLEHQVPLPKALQLAADATGNREIHREMSEVSRELATGKSLGECVLGRPRIPSYLRWSLGAAQRSDIYQGALRHGAEMYRGKAAFRADMIKMWLPIVLVIVLGGGAVLVYTLGIWLPMRALYWQLNLDGMR